MNRRHFLQGMSGTLATCSAPAELMLYGSTTLKLLAPMSATEVLYRQKEWAEHWGRVAQEACDPVLEKLAQIIIRASL